MTNALATVLLDGTSSTATEGTFDNYSWVELGGAPDPADTEETTVELEPGTFTFQLIVTDSNGLTDETSVTVTIDQPKLDTIRQILQSSLSRADRDSSGALNVAKALSIIPYLEPFEFNSLDDSQDEALDETELSVKPREYGRVCRYRYHRQHILVR